jgi:hypothetical protein
MARLFKNKTAEDVSLRYENETLVIKANTELELTEYWTTTKINSCDDLIAYLAQGVDKYQLNDGSNDLTVNQSLELLRGWKEPGPMPVKNIDTQGLDPETALSCTEFVEVGVETGEEVSEGLISYPFPVDVAAARYVMEDPHYEYGDKFDVFGIPAGDPAIGGVTAPAAQGDTSINISSTVFQYSRAGMYLKFQGHNDEYRIESMDASAETVELMAPLEEAVGAGETIHVRRPFLINGWVCKNLIYPIGDLTSGSSELSANDMIRIRYYHKTTPTEDYVLPFALAMLF